MHLRLGHSAFVVDLKAILCCLCLSVIFFVFAEKGRNITKPKVEILQPSKHECRNNKDKKRKKTLVCVASDFYPDHVSVSWKMNGEKVTKGVATDEAAVRVDDGTYRITSRLRVYAPEWENPQNTFTCTVSFYNGKDNTDYSNEIRGVEGNFLWNLIFLL